MITIKNCEGNPIAYKNLTFPAGERHIAFNDYFTDLTLTRNHVEVHVHFEGSDDIVDLMLIGDILRNHVHKTLVMHYMPFSRQDRAVNKGEAHALRAFAKLVNSLGFERVVTYDPHSTVCEALFENLVIKTQLEAFTTTVGYNSGMDYVLAPDAGASKKAFEIAKAYGVPMLQALKERDPKTGEVTGVVLASKAPEVKSTIMVVDDICDGGRTFIELAKIPELQGHDLRLFVTHGIFSKGIDVLKPYYNQIYTFNRWSN